jgi:stage V sporulation protein D (sporulation-specific penicillin-binding protein)
MRGEKLRFWIPIGLIALCMGYVGFRLVMAHFESDLVAPRYEFTKEMPGCRGSIYAAGGGNKSLMAKSIPLWEYRLDPVSLTNTIVRRRGHPPRKVTAILRTISDALDVDYKNLLKMSANTKDRYQFILRSADKNAHKLLSDSKLVSGVVIEDKQVRQYIYGKRLSHVIGSVNSVGMPLSGIELKFNKELEGVPGIIRGKRDARGNELYDKRIEKVAPIPGADIYLTINDNLQYEVETALAAGIKEYEAASGWCIVLDARTAAILAMASYPDFEPSRYGKTSDSQKRNRAISLNYEPGSVMKVITAAAAINDNFVTPHTMYSTDRFDDRYYRLPGDGSHKWPEKMSVTDAIVHSSNIVIGKLGYDFGAQRLWKYMRAFGFGRKIGIDLPGEESGILPSFKDWNKATWSRAPIGQGISVTALQLASAYQAIANDGTRIKPYIVERVIGADGQDLHKHSMVSLGNPISVATSREIRRMMLNVATREGTARRAAIRGYSIAGKTGTAQKVVDRKYAPGLYIASFCGIVPSGVVCKNQGDDKPVEPKFVILVSLDFDKRARYHQGGNSAAPVFKRIALAALRYYEVEPDCPDQLMDELKEDEFNKILDERGL